MSAPDRIGRYELLEPLGRGGMGVVYRARDAESGRMVALKTVRLAQQSLLAGIRREIHTLARLRHPGIVRIVEEGQHEGLPWYAMELLEGQTLRRWGSGEQAAEDTPETRSAATEWWTRGLGCEEGEQSSAGSEGVPGMGPSWGQPAEADGKQPAEGVEDGRPTEGLEGVRRGGRLGQILTLVRALCSPLAFLHGEGVVHRDLKPDNVLVRPDGTPVLVDFGLVTQFASELGRETLEIGGMMLGTVSYMAPEQIRGEMVDARADLYSLGCILYELLSGRPPFVDSSPRGVLAQHLELAPEAPSRRRPGLPEELDELVLSLLAKSPRQRLGHADAVAATLAKLGAVALSGPEAPKARAYLYRPGFAGRQESLELLERRLAGLEEGHGALVLIGGESGVGKTRLALELGRLARRWNVRVLAGEAVARSASEVGLPGGGPLEALRKPLRSLADRCRELGEGETERLLGVRAPLLGLYEPALQGLPGQPVEAQDVAPLPADAARMRLFSALTETFGALAEAGADPATSSAKQTPKAKQTPGTKPMPGTQQASPLLLIVDDLQWADELTLGWLGYLLRGGHLERRPLLLVGTYRSEEAGPALQEVLGHAGVQRFDLGRLEEAAVAAMVGNMLALSPAPPLLSRYLSGHSEGNPFFVAEYLRAAVEEGFLWRDSSAVWQVAEDDYERLGLPRSLRELVRRRLHGLEPGALALVSAAAVLGREAELALLERMSGLDRGALVEPVAELLRRQILEEPEPGRLRFTHEKVRELSYEVLAAEERRGLHRAAGEALEELLEAGQNVLRGVLGQHWELAGFPEQARKRYLEGANEAIASHALAEAERLLRGYLSLVREPDLESVEARYRLGLNVLRLRGHAVAAIEEVSRALEEARRLGGTVAIARGLRILGVLYRETGKPEESRRHLEEGLALTASDPSALEERGVLLGSLANLHKLQGRPEQATALYEEAISIARLLGLANHEGQHIGNLANIHKDLGRFEEARRLYEESLAIKRRIGERRGEGITLGNIASLLSEQGRYEEAIRFKDRALAILREVGDRRSEGNELTTLADESDPEANRRQYQAALRIHRETENRSFQGVTLNYAASLERRLGELDEAERMLREARQILDEVGDRLQTGVCCCEEGLLALARGRTAGDYLTDAEAIAVQLAARPASGLGQEIQRLRDSIEAFEAGRHELLFQGERIEDIPEPLRRWLVEKGHLEAARARLEERSAGQLLADARSPWRAHRGRGDRASEGKPSEARIIDPSGLPPQEKADST